MEAPKCRLCGERHWGGCLRTLKDVMKELPAEEHAKVKKRTKELSPVDTTPPSVDTTPPPVVSTCPVCEARKKARTLAQKKWRSRKPTGEI